MMSVPGPDRIPSASSPPMSCQGDTDSPDQVANDEPDTLPTAYGRYRVISALGRGGFGQVYRAVDDQLKREVAVKVTLTKTLPPNSKSMIESEAEILASLDHPNIVPVFDSGHTKAGDFFLVSKLITGSDLAERIQKNPPSLSHSLKIVESIAEALAYAHSKGLVHRDVKPANILIDDNDLAYLTDFGIALREIDRGKQVGNAGTPAYMSPEQARGECHRVDHRSDIFSLGLILYELLTGRLPFRSENYEELKEQIAYGEIRSPRLFDWKITPEIERVCLKSLARRPSDRFQVAWDFADEIRRLIDRIDPSMSSPAFPKESHSTPPISVFEEPVSSQPEIEIGNRDSRQVPQSDFQLATDRHEQSGVHPKGLRCFDSSDSDSFLSILPGPFDRHGLPESLSFWKKRIEETDETRTFRVGILYGPSGSGKSSLMKAGLLTRLGPNVVTVYVEAVPGRTDTIILGAIRKAVPDAKGDSLKEVLGDIRKRKLMPPGSKLTLVIDQFEQWLHAEIDYARARLTHALMECDGASVQAILMVRDDFWMSVSRFMRELDIPIVERENSAMVDLFDLDHARKVLGLFGIALGKLPGNPADWSPDQIAFVHQAITGMAQDRQVVPVRIAIFADMTKRHDWSKRSLAEVGGTEGVGVTFLDEMFGMKHSPIRNRPHQQAARNLLAALLPPAGTDIKGSMRSADHLKAISGYARKPREFAELIHILDKDLRLITPVDETAFDTDSNPAEDSPNSSATVTSRPFSYQLTHDYLVPSLREWLTRLQRETRKGCAELKLAERAAAWNTNRENKQLPTLAEGLSIRLRTDRNRWTEPQRSMMRKAARVHCVKWGGTMASILSIILAVLSWGSARKSESLQQQTEVTVRALQENLGNSVVSNLRELKSLPRKLVIQEMVRRFGASKEPEHDLALAFGLASFGSPPVVYLVDRIHEIKETDTANFVDALASQPEWSISSIKRKAEECIHPSDWRLKAKLATTALALGDASIAVDMCTFANRTDPGQRTIFVDEFPKWEWHLPQRGMNLIRLANLVRNSQDPGFRSGICLAVGSIARESLTKSEIETWSRLAMDWYSSMPDSSTHSAAMWLLNHWNVPLRVVADQHRIDPGRQWFVNSQGSTMIRIDRPKIERDDPRDRFRKDLEELRTATGEEMAKPRTRLRRAIAYYQTGDFDKALNDLNYLHERRELMKSVRFYRTLALARLGQEAEARKSLEEYERLVIEPDWKVKVHYWETEMARTIPSNWEELMKSTPVAEWTGKGSSIRLDDKLRQHDVRDEFYAAVANVDIRFTDEPVELMLTYDDGVRVWLDNEIVFQDWVENSERTRRINLEQASGDHELRIDYFQSRGEHLLEIELNPSESDHVENYLRILVPLWSGQFDEAETRLDKAMNTIDSQSSSLSVLTLARTAALCAETAKDDPARSMPFKDKVLSLISKLRDRSIIDHPDFECMTEDERYEDLLSKNRTIPTKPYWIGATEVTLDQFDRFISDPSTPQELKPKFWPGVHRERDHPAESVSWYDAIAYCNWLSLIERKTPRYRKTGRKEIAPDGTVTEHDSWEEVLGADGYRLLTENEWEFACRSGFATSLSIGDDFGDDTSTLLAGYSRHALPFRFSVPVGLKKPNPWGIFDMHGNVSEYCNEVDRGYARCKGGSFESMEHDCLVTAKHGIPPWIQDVRHGFRIGLSDIEKE